MQSVEKQSEEQGTSSWLTDHTVRRTSHLARGSPTCRTPQEHAVIFPAQPPTSPSIYVTCRYLRLLVTEPINEQDIADEKPHLLFRLVFSPGVYRDHPNEYNRGCPINSFSLLCAPAPRSRLPDLSELVHVRDPPLSDRSNNRSGGGSDRGSGIFSFIAPAGGFGLGGENAYDGYQQMKPQRAHGQRANDERERGSSADATVDAPKSSASEPSLSLLAMGTQLEGLEARTEAAETKQAAAATTMTMTSPDPAHPRGAAQSSSWSEGQPDDGGVGDGDAAATASAAPLAAEGGIGKGEGGGSKNGNGNGNGAPPARGTFRRENSSSSDVSWQGGEVGQAASGLGGAAGAQQQQRGGRLYPLVRADSGGASPLVGLSYANSPLSALDLSTVSGGVVTPPDDAPGIIRGGGGDGRRGALRRAAAAAQEAEEEKARRSPMRTNKSLPALSPEGVQIATAMDAGMWADGDTMGGSQSSGELWYSPTAPSSGTAAAGLAPASSAGSAPSSAAGLTLQDERTAMLGSNTNNAEGLVTLPPRLVGDEGERRSEESEGLIGLGDDAAAAEAGGVAMACAPPVGDSATLSSSGSDSDNTTPREKSLP